MELPLRVVDKLPTATAQRNHNSHDSAQENDFTYGAERDLSLDFENPIMDWYGVFDRTAGLDSTMGNFQHDQMPQSPQSNMATMGSFNLPPSMPDVFPITWFPVDQPVDQLMNHHFYSDKPPSLSYEQLVNPGTYSETGLMESWPNLPTSLVDQYQNTLWPTSNPEILNSNSDSNFFNDNSLTTYFELCTPSERSAEPHRPNTTTSTPRSSKSHKQRRNSKLSIAVEKRRKSTTALVSIPVRCMACKASRIACIGPPDCKRCQLKCIPGQMYTTIDLSEVLNFDKWLEKEYELKRVYPPTHYLREVKVAFLQHHVKGPELKVECYYFEPDPTEPSQTTIYWKEERWKEAHTTAVSLTNLKYELEPYIEQMVDIILDEARNGPYYIAKFFQDIQKFRKSPVMSLPLKLFAVVRLLKKGWFISESRTHPKESLGNSVLYAEKSPWHAKIPAPSTVQRQLDRMLELLAAKWEPMVYKGWQRIMRQGKQRWLEMFYVGFLIMHILEQDAQRLKIHCEEQNTINDWKHPVKPMILVEKAIHFCNTFLTHFRGMSGMKHPLRLEWLPDDTKRLAKGNRDIIKVMESLQKHRNYLKAENLIGRRPCDTYKPGHDDSLDFTWSSGLLDETGRMIQMKDYLGAFN